MIDTESVMGSFRVVALREGFVMSVEVRVKEGVKQFTIARVNPEQLSQDLAAWLLELDMLLAPTKTDATVLPFIERRSSH